MVDKIRNRGWFVYGNNNEFKQYLYVDEFCFRFRKFNIYNF